MPYYKSVFSVSLLILVLLIAFGVYGDGLFNEPESVVFDYDSNRYFVSNKNDGKIIVLDSLLTGSVFNDTLSSCRGLHILDGHLYGAGTEGIVEIDLETGKTVRIIEIKGRTFLNDITSDTLGNLYVTDSSQGKIYKIRPETYFYTDFATGLTGINGILYIPDPELLYFCTGRDIKRVDLADSSVTEVIRTYHGQLDGLAIDSTGYIYFSSWGSDGVFRYDPLFSLEEADTISTGHIDPADIYINTRDNILAVPNYSDNTVDFIDLTPIITDVDGENPVPEGFELYQNYPNPFNPITTIRFQVPEYMWTSLDVYNITGQKVATLLNGFVQPGFHSIDWDAARLSSGVYIYSIVVGDYRVSRKMVFVK